MKILYLVHQFYPDYFAGTEKVVLNIASMMQTLGHKVKVVTFCFDNNYEKRWKNTHYKEYIYRGLPVLAYRNEKNSYDFNQIWYGGKATEFANHIIKRENPDIVHVAHPMRVGDFVMASFELGIPYILTLTDFWLICPKIILRDSSGHLCLGPRDGEVCGEQCPELSQNINAERLMKAENVLFKSKKIITPSIFLASIFKRKFPDINIQVIGHGINHDNLVINKRVYRNTDKIVFGYAGSLVEHKGVHILIHAFKEAKEQNIALKIFGPESDLIYVKKIRNLALADPRIEFCGAYSENSIGAMFSQIDVIVIPSICYESYSLILHEAMASGIPVIVSGAGGLLEKVHDGEHGYTFSIGDAISLSRIITKLARDTSILNDMKRHLMNTMVPSVEQEAYRYEREYKNMLKSDVQ